MGVLARFVALLLTAAIAVVIVVGVWISDANNLKPELKALIAEHSDYQAVFNGDVSWSLLPPLHLMVSDLTLTREDETISIAHMDLQMDLSAMWEDIDQWQVTQLQLSDITRTEGDTSSLIQALSIQNFRPGQPANFTVTATHSTHADAQPLHATLNGIVTFYPATDNTTQRLKFADTQVTTDLARGVCQADLAEASQIPTRLPAAGEDDLLPVATLLSYSLTADCELSELTIGAETFHTTTATITNVGGHTNLLLDIQDFLEGTLVTDIDIDLTRTPIEWTVVPEVHNVDSQRLLDWTEQRLQWIAPVAFNSTINMHGNTEAELAASLTAASEFDGGQGQLNIATIKQQLMQIALLTRQTDEVSTWPDVWDYQEFTGRWNINGPVHDMKFAIDNMSVDANGQYDYLGDAMDFLLNVTVHEPPEDSPFKINPLLEGTPIPVRCTGPSAEPKCRLDEAAAQKLIARALRPGDDSGLRRKLEQKIDEEVPEEYRDTARSILELLGRALDEE